MRKSNSLLLSNGFLITIIFSMGLPSLFSAVVYPGLTPSGEVAGGTFNTYFTNMFSAVGISETAPTYTAGCAMGEVMRGMTNTGMLLCISPGLGSTSSATLALSGSLVGTLNYVAKYNNLAGTGINNSQIYDNGTNVGIATTLPNYKLDVAGTGSFYGLRVSSGAVNGYVLTSNAIGLAYWGLPPSPCIAAGTGLDNTCYGIGVLGSNTTGFNNSSFGSLASQMNTTGSNNSSFGRQALQNNSIGIGNTANGSSALRFTTGNWNTAVGQNSLYINVSGNNNTAVGLNALTNNITGNNNTANGFSAGQNLTSGDNNIALGANTDFPLATASNQLNIANAIFGNGLSGTVGAPAGNIGIGVANPTAKLEVAGQIKITGGVPGIGKTLISDANGLASWTDTVSGSTATGIIGGSGTQNYISKFGSGGTGIYPSQFYDDGVNIGLGTTSPSARLEVNGQIKITGGSPGFGKILASDALGLASWVSPAAVSGAWATIGNTGTLAGTNFLGTTDNQALVFKTNNAENMRITTTGDIGIGTPTPGARLEVAGQIKITGGAPGLGKTLVSDAAGLATWTSTVSGSTATGVIGGSGSQNYLSKFGTGGMGIYISQLFDNGTNIGIGTINPGAKLEVAGQIKITGGTPGLGKTLVSDATGLASWTDTVSGSTATGIIGGSGSQNYLSKFGTGGMGIYTSQLFDNGTNIGIGTISPTTKVTIDSGINGTGGLRFTRISSSTTPYPGTTTGLGVDSSGNVVPISSGDVVVYTAEGGHPKTTTPDPDLPNRLISYDFNTYFAIPTKQSFVVSDGAGAGYNAPYFKENGVSGICSGGGSPYDCVDPDPVVGVSASPNNSFTMTAKGTTYGYQLALGARGDAPLFARSGKFVGSQTGGLFLADNVTPTPWQKVLTVPANHLEYFYVNIGYNSQLTAIPGGGNVGIGTSFPDRRLVVASSGTTSASSGQLQVRRGFQGADAALGNTYGTPYINVGGLENRSGSIQTIGFGYNSLSGTVRYAPAEIGFLTTSVVGNTQGAIVFANRNGTTNIAPSEVMRIASNGSVGIGTNNPTSRLEIDSGIADESGLKFKRLTSASPDTIGTIKAVGVDGSGNVVAVTPLSNIAVYKAIDRNSTNTPDPNLNTREIIYKFNNYFSLPGDQSFVVSDGNTVSKDGPYIQENGTTGICSSSGSPYDCITPVNGLSASPQNSFTMSAKSANVGYQIALSARGDAPLLARSGFFNLANVSTGGLYLADRVTPTPWQKVLSIPVNHPEFLFVNTGFNSQLATQTGAGNVGVGTTFPNSRFEVWTGASTAPLLHFRGTNNVAIGLDALDVVATGTLTSANNTAVGYNAGSNLTTGSNNILIGADTRAQAATSANTLNIGNTIFGNSLPSAFGGTAGNIGIGIVAPTQQLAISRSFQMPVTTSASTGVLYKGASRFMHDYTASSFTPNIFIGTNAGNFTMTQGYNIGIGNDSLSLNTSGYSNIAFGALSLSKNTSGGNNSAIGAESLENNTTGNNNVANGFKALFTNVGGGSNTAIGAESLTANTASSNTAVGYRSMYGNTSGPNNVAIGLETLYTNISGQNNTAVGYQALRAANSPSSNTAIGYQAGNTITTGANNIAVGAGAQVVSATASNQLSIGNWIYGSGGDIGIGAPSPTAKLEINGQIKITGGSPGAGKILMSDATGLAVWQTPSGGAVIPWAIAGNSGTTTASNFIGTIDTVDLAFRTNNVERMRMTSTGFLGLGKTNPSYRLDINGEMGVNNWIRSTGNFGWYSQTYGGGVYMTDSTWVRIFGSKSLWTDAYIHSTSGITVGYNGTTPPTAGAIFSGSVGIGTNAPTASTRLDVNGLVRIAGGNPGNGKVLVSDATGIASWQNLSGASGALANWSIAGNSGMLATTNFIGTTDANPLVIRTNNAEQLRIDTAGNLGIGTNAPGAKLDVNGLIISRNNNAAYFQGGDDAQLWDVNVANTVAIRGLSNSALGSLQLGNNTAAYVAGNGTNIGIGTTTPGAKLEVAGTIKITGGTPGLGKILTSDAAGLASWGTVPGSITEWSRSGNTISSTDFLGSLNTQDLVFKTNNIERVRILQNGNVSMNGLTLGRGGNGTQVSTTALGVSALLSNTSGTFNTAMGNSALASVISGSFNTAFGANALFSTTGNNNTAIGYNAGTAITSGTNNIAIGYNSAVPSNTASNQLSIGNWIYGIGGNIGIGTNNPGQKLTVSGALQIMDGSQGTGKYLVSDANGVASWKSPTAGSGVYIYRMTNVQTTSSTTLSSIAELTSLPLPTGPYQFELIGKFQSSNLSNGIGITLSNISASSTDFIASVSTQLTDSTVFQSSFFTPGTAIVSTDVPAVNTDYAVLMKGTFNVTTAGTVAIQYRSELGGNSVSLRPGTMLLIRSIDPTLIASGI